MRLIGQHIQICCLQVEKHVYSLETILCLYKIILQLEVYFLCKRGNGLISIHEYLKEA